MYINGLILPKAQNLLHDKYVTTKKNAIINFVHLKICRPKVIEVLYNVQDKFNVEVTSFLLCY